MAKLKPCKTCGVDVATSANVCPACGEKHPGVNLREARNGFIFLIAVLFVAAFFISICSDKSEPINPFLIRDLDRVGSVDAKTWLGLDQQIRLNSAAHYYFFNSETGVEEPTNLSELLDFATVLEDCVTKEVKARLGEDYNTSGRATDYCFDKQKLGHSSKN